MKLTEYLSEKNVEANVALSSSSTVLARLVKLIQAPGEFMDSKTLLSEIKEREKLGSTGIGEGVAIPHVHLQSIAETHVALLTTKIGIDFGAIDDKSCRIFIIVVAPGSDREGYLRILSAVSGLMRRENVRESILAARNSAELLKAIQQAE